MALIEKSATSPQLRSMKPACEPSGSEDRGGMARAFSRLRLVGDAVMIRHTLFSLPFVLSAVLLETAGKPPFWKLFWIVMAAMGARNAANALNRLVDKKIDATNPRTADRPLPSGKLKDRTLWIFTACMLALLVVGAAMLNPLCVILLPVAGFLVFGYSYTKRFTWLCHFWLGVTCSAATMGAFLGISGRFELRYFPIVAAVALWVAGFDILYALQDERFDREHGLHSVPARFGKRGARTIAALSHFGTLLGLASVFLFWNAPGVGTAAALFICAILLVAEHAIALGGTGKHIRIAAYGINEIIPLIFFFGIVFDTYLL
jgi:4-hydroxybenzoate polyprenyltransferase